MYYKESDLKLFTYFKEAYFQTPFKIQAYYFTAGDFYMKKEESQFIFSVTYYVLKWEWTLYSSFEEEAYKKPM